MSHHPGGEGGDNQSMCFLSCALIMRPLSPYVWADSRPANDNITKHLVHLQCSCHQPALSFRLQLVPDQDTNLAGTSDAASQADVACFKALKESPDATKYPYAARWWKHIATYEADFAKLPGDASKPYTVYGPDDVTSKEEADDVDLFGSDKEEDAEAARIREERLTAYKEKKAAKPKAAAKSVVIMDVKPWGAYWPHTISFAL